MAKLHQKVCLINRRIGIVRKQRLLWKCRGRQTNNDICSARLVSQILLLLCYRMLDDKTKRQFEKIGFRHTIVPCLDSCEDVLSYYV